MSELMQIPKPTRHTKYRLQGQVQVKPLQALSSLELYHLFQLLLLQWDISETHAWREDMGVGRVLKCWKMGYS